MTEQLSCSSKPCDTQEEAEAYVERLYDAVERRAKDRGWSHVGYPPLFLGGVASSYLYKGARAVIQWSPSWGDTREGWVARVDALYAPTVEVLLTAAP